MNISTQRAAGIIVTRDDEMVFIQLNGKQTNYKLVPMQNSEVEEFYQVDRAQIHDGTN